MKDQRLRERIEQHKKREQLSIQELQKEQGRLDEVLIRLQDNPDFQELCVLLYIRREGLLDQILAGDLPRKKELITTGQTIELNFIMRLNDHGKQLQENKSQPIKEQVDVTSTGL